jgi:glycosyltransferase involved in cell wall biosynthesis
MASVDVVIPVYNRQEPLERAVNSVVNQSYTDWTLTIVDDGSGADFKAWLKEKMNSSWSRLNLQVITLLERRGVSRARNLGVDKGSSPWVAFLDSDDEWLPQKLEKQLAYAKEYPQYLLIHTEEIWVRNGARVNACKKHAKSGGRIFLRCLPLCCISPSTTLIARSLYVQQEGFREDFPVCEDYELWLRICSQYEVGFLQEALIVKYGGHADQLSRSEVGMDYWRVKALAPFLKSQYLAENEREAVATTIKAKCRILLNGYKKYENWCRYDEVNSLYQQSAGAI